MKKVLIGGAILAILGTACESRPKEIMSDKETVELISDLRIADAMFDAGQGSRTGFSTRERAELGVMKAHGVSPEKYRKTIEWYGENLDKFDEMNKSVEKNLRKRLAKIDPNVSSHVTEDNNIWPYPNHLIFRPGMISDGFTFTIGDPGIEKGGYAELKMKTSDSNTSMTVLVGVDYADGSTSYIGRTNSGFEQIKVRVQSDTARRVKRIYGYFRPSNMLVNTITFDSISLIKMPMDTTEYYRISVQTNIDMKR